MTRKFGFEGDNWHDTMTAEDKRAMRFPNTSAELSLGELSYGSFLPCVITDSSEIFVSANYAYDLALGRACRVDAMKAYVRYLQRVIQHDEVALSYCELEQVYNRVIWACSCGIPQERMAKDLSNLRTYWLPRLCKQNQNK